MRTVQQTTTFPLGARVRLKDTYRAPLATVVDYSGALGVVWIEWFEDPQGEVQIGAVPPEALERVPDAAPDPCYGPHHLPTGAFALRPGNPPASPQ
jgi:hypothetical protein